MVSLFTEDEPLAALALFQIQLSDPPDLTQLARNTVLPERVRTWCMTHDSRSTLHLM